VSNKTKDINTTLAIIRTIDAEKRTHLAELRTGIGILTIPMSLLTILIATSDYYSVAAVLSLIVAVVTGIIILTAIGAYLVIIALKKLRKTELLRGQCKDLACLMEEYQNSD
jgi:uncharacterized membrane protein YidH (DUF202 family)